MVPDAPAGFARRACAKLVDGVAVGWLAFTIGILWVHLAIGPDAFDPHANSSTTTGLSAAFFGACAAPLIFIAYNVVFLSAWGATPGRLLLAVNVVSADGGPVRVGRALQRTLAEFPSLLLGGTGYWLAGAGRQTLHDRWSKTIVVRAHGRVLPGFGATPVEVIALAVVGIFVAVGFGIVSLGPSVARLAESFRPAHDRYIAAGIRANANGDTKEALQAFTKALEVNPRSALAYANRGAVYGDMGLLDLQIADCTAALSLDSTHVFALLGRGNARRALKQYPEAMADYTEAIRVRPEWDGLVFAYRGRGAALYRLGRFEEAGADFAEGMRIGMENYLGTSDFPKGVSFIIAIDMCREFYAEAFRRGGRGPSEVTMRKVPVVGKPDELYVRSEALREWLGIGEAAAAPLPAR